MHVRVHVCVRVRTRVCAPCALSPDRPHSCSHPSIKQIKKNTHEQNPKKNADSSIDKNWALFTVFTEI